MDQSLTKKKGIKVIDITLPDRCFDYLWPKGEVICIKDKDFKLEIMKLEISAIGWFNSSIRLQLKSSNAKKWKIFRSRLPSMKSNSFGSGFDKVDNLF